MSGGEASNKGYPQLSNHPLFLRAPFHTSIADTAARTSPWISNASSLACHPLTFL